MKTQWMMSSRIFYKFPFLLVLSYGCVFFGACECASRVCSDSFECDVSHQLHAIHVIDCGECDIGLVDVGHNDSHDY